MYSDCIRCRKLGVVCKGPNFTDMSTPDIIDWMRARKSYLGWTSQTLSDRSGVPDGTIKRVLSSSDGGFKVETIAPMLQALTGSNLVESSCLDPDGSIEEKLTSRVRHLEKELSDTKSLAARNDTINSDQIVHLKSQAKNFRNALIVAASLLIVVLLVIICVLAYDVTHQSIGYFGR